METSDGSSSTDPPKAIESTAGIGEGDNGNMISISGGSVTYSDVSVPLPEALTSSVTVKLEDTPTTPTPIYTVVLDDGKY